MLLYSPDTWFLISSLTPLYLAGFVAFLLVDKHSHHAAHPASALRGSWRRGYIKGLKIKKEPVPIYFMTRA